MCWAPNAQVDHSKTLPQNTEALPSGNPELLVGVSFLGFPNQPRHLWQFPFFGPFEFPPKYCQRWAKKGRCSLMIDGILLAGRFVEFFVCTCEDDNHLGATSVEIVLGVWSWRLGGKVRLGKHRRDQMIDYIWIFLMIQEYLGDCQFFAPSWILVGIEYIVWVKKPYRSTKDSCSWCTTQGRPTDSSAELHSNRMQKSFKWSRERITNWNTESKKKLRYTNI